MSKTGLVGVLLLLAVVGVAAFAAHEFLAGPELRELTPARARVGEAIVLKGSRFSADAAANIVLVGDRTGRVLRAATGELEIEVPEPATPLDAEVQLPVRVLVGTRVSPPQTLSLYAGADPAVTADASSQSAAAPAASAAGPVPGNAGSAPAVTAPGITPRPKPAGPKGARSSPAGERTDAREPAPAPEPVGRPREPAALPAPRRGFLPGATSVESTKEMRAELDGFDTRGVDLKRAPDVSGRIEFDVQPPRVKEGDAYNVRVYLRNQGKKPIRIEQLLVASTVNGARARSSVTPKLKEVDVQKNGLIAEVPGVWQEGVTSWSLEVTVTSKRGDSYKNHVAWK